MIMDVLGQLRTWTTTPNPGSGALHYRQRSYDKNRNYIKATVRV